VTAFGGPGPAPSQALWVALASQCQKSRTYSGALFGARILEDGPWSQVVVRGVPAAHANPAAIKSAVFRAFTRDSPSEATAAVADVRSLLKPGQDNGEPRTICVSFTRPKIAAAC
jgi:hypothetical protein